MVGTYSNSDIATNMAKGYLQNDQDVPCPSDSDQWREWYLLFWFPNQDAQVYCSYVGTYLDHAQILNGVTKI